MRPQGKLALYKFLNLYCFCSAAPYPLAVYNITTRPNRADTRGTTRGQAEAERRRRLHRPRPSYEDPRERRKD